jgi:outer membrane protein assembly factor BamB
MSLFFISAIIPITFGSNIRTTDNESIVEDYNHDRHLYPEYYDCPNIDKITTYDSKYVPRASTNSYNTYTEEIINLRELTQSFAGPMMDSPWPMYCHDVRHTGQSPYSTINNPGVEKWLFDTIDDASGSPVIDDQGIIYIGSSALHAIYPNGMLKWKYETYYHSLMLAPAIADNGVIYFGTAYGNHYLFAIYTSNGTLKWKFYTGASIFSSPAIGNDGTIYFGDSNNHINALHPNGTLKWKYTTGDVVLSSPAIDDDGTIYCGSHDYNVYALYPNNGSLKWKFATNGWVHGSPAIGEDGTVYIGSDDGYLYALYPNNGTMKWRCNVGGAVWGSPALDGEGNLYLGVWNGQFHAVYPNGKIKWSFDTGGHVWWTSATLSDDGTIYFGSNIGDYGGGELIALNLDGNECWRIMVASDWTMSTPAIGEDGTVYVGSCNDGYHPGSWGYLHAIGELDIDSPSAPDIHGPQSGKPNRKYDYTFKSTSPLGNDVYYYVDWGDNTVEEWIGSYTSGEEITLSHTWHLQGIYTIKARAKDTDNLWGPWETLTVTIPRNKATYNLLRLLEWFPLLQKISIFLTI